MKGDRVRKGEDVTKIPPEALRQRARKGKVTQSLNLVRTIVAKHLLRGEHANAIPQRQGIEKEFVERFLVPWRARTVVEALPNVRRRATKFCDVPRTPVEGAFFLLLVEKPASQSGSERQKHDTCHLNVGMESITRASGGRRGRGREG